MLDRLAVDTLTALSQTITPFASSLLKPSKPPLNFLSLNYGHSTEILFWGHAATRRRHSINEWILMERQKID